MSTAREGPRRGRRPSMNRTPARNACSMSPATTEVTCRLLSSVTLTMKSQPAMRAIRGVLLVDRVAVEDAAIGVGVFEQLGPVPSLDRLERGDAGADQLAAAGVAGHQVGLDQARWRSSGRPGHIGCRSSRGSRGPSCRRACAPRAGCRNGPRPDSRRAISAPSISSFSASVLGRCSPVATRMSVRSRGIPASSRTLSIGRRIVRLGTGRVMSQIRMQASLPTLRDLARARACRSAARARLRRLSQGLRAQGTSRMASGPTTRSAGSSTVNPVRP